MQNIKIGYWNAVVILQVFFIYAFAIKGQTFICKYLYVFIRDAV